MSAFSSLSGSPRSWRGAVWGCHHDEHPRDKVCFRDGLWAKSSQANCPEQNPDQWRELQDSPGAGLRPAKCRRSEKRRGARDAGRGDGIRWSWHWYCSHALSLWKCKIKSIQVFCCSEMIIFPFLSDGFTFVKRHQAALIQRLKSVEPVLEHLRDQNVLSM